MRQPRSWQPQRRGRKGNLKRQRSSRELRLHANECIDLEQDPYRKGSVVKTWSLNQAGEVTQLYHLIGHVIRRRIKLRRVDRQQAGRALAALKHASGEMVVRRISLQGWWFCWQADDSGLYFIRIRERDKATIALDDLQHQLGCNTAVELSQALRRRLRHEMRDDVDTTGRPFDPEAMSRMERVLLQIDNVA